MPVSPTHFASIKRLIVLSGVLIAGLTLALVPLLSQSGRGALLQQAEQYTINEFHHLNYMQWKSFMSPLLLDQSITDQQVAEFRSYLSNSTQGPTVQTLTVYGRDGTLLFAPHGGPSISLTPSEAVAAMQGVASAYTERDGLPFLQTRIPVAIDGSIPRYKDPLPADAEIPYEDRKGGNMVHTLPLNQSPIIGLITLDQNIQAAVSVFVRYQWTTELLLVGLMGALFLALFIAMRHTERLIASQYGQLQAQHSALQRLEATKEELSNMLLHDLRNPVTAIVSSLDILAMPDFGNLSPAQTEIIEQAQLSGQRMTSMLNDLLMISRLEEGQLKLELKPFEPRASLQAMMTEMQPWVKRSGHLLDLQIDPAAPPVSLDHSLLQRVIGNLVGNAINHTPAGTSIMITAASQQGGLELRVTDTGPAISVADQAQIFQRWSQGREHGSGHGLGLTFCQLAVKAHGGSLRVESEVGKGASFIIWLPITPPVIQPIRAVQPITLPVIV